MKRTISIKLKPTAEQTSMLAAIQQEFALACNLLVSFAQSARTFNAISLDHLAYYEARGKSALGSQMVYQAIKSVAGKYKALKLKKKGDVPVIEFKPKSVHYDKKTNPFFWLHLKTALLFHCFLASVNANSTMPVSPGKPN
ncbi:MAG: hypothetical protein ACU4EQ_01620 [Candidatus Nitrosoglobus sp.]